MSISPPTTTTSTATASPATLVTNAYAAISRAMHSVSAEDDAARTNSSPAHPAALALNIAQVGGNSHDSNTARPVPALSTERESRGGGSGNVPNHLPPSPPSTPSHSPNEEGPVFSWTSSRADELRDAVEMMRMGENSVNAAQAHPGRREPSANEEMESRSWNASTKKGDQDISKCLPETPDASPLFISPAEGNVHHHPSMSALAFVKSVLPKLKPFGGDGQHSSQGRYIIEDAGMELVCPGWTGAVLIDVKPKTATVPSMPSTPRMRSSRMSRTSSTASRSSAGGAGVPERTPPHRTLLSRINAASHQYDAAAFASSLSATAAAPSTKDLRAHVLDALDHATERLHVDNVVFVLDRSGIQDDEHFRAIVHGLCYVGANVIGHGPLSSSAAADEHIAGSSDLLLSSSLLSQSSSSHMGSPLRARSHPGAESAGISSSSINDTNTSECVLRPRTVAPNLVLLSVDV